MSRFRLLAVAKFTGALLVVVLLVDLSGRRAVAQKPSRGLAQGASRPPAVSILPRLPQTQAATRLPSAPQLQRLPGSYPRPSLPPTKNPFPLPNGPVVKWPPPVRPLPGSPRPDKPPRHPSPDKPPENPRPQKPPIRIPPIIVVPDPIGPRPRPRPQPIPPAWPNPQRVGPIAVPVKPTPPLEQPALRPAVPANELPPLTVRVPRNMPAADRLKPASSKVARAVGGEVKLMLQKELESLSRKLSDAPFGRDRARESALEERLGKLKDLAGGGASLKEIVRSGRELRDALESLKSEGNPPAGFEKWVKDVTSGLEGTLLLAGVNEEIADALAGGLGPAAGPLGPGGLAPGADGPDPEPDPDGPGDLAPGGDGPGPGAGPAPGEDGFDIDIDLHLWFGHGSWPIVCYPHLPAGHCCWIGETILVCGTGGFGSTYVVYGSPAYVGLPLPSAEPISDAPAEADYRDRILLLNPEENRGPVNYVLGENRFAMDAGMRQDVRLTATAIRFARGPGLGEARYALRSGTYRFVVTEKGWDLNSISYRAAIDNTANSSDFQMLVDGELVTIPARSSKEVTSPYPLLVEFDDGDGGEPARKQLEHNETYTVGIDLDAGLWDLFLGDATASGAGKADEITLIASAGLLSAPTSIAAPASITAPLQ